MTTPTDDRDPPGPPADDGRHPSPNPTSSGQDRDTEALTRMLTALADDPDAPTSSVTTESVLAAARAEQTSGPRLTAVPGEGRPVTSRRRTGLIALAAAAALAGVAAIVIPLALNGSGSSNTASDSAAEATVVGPTDAMPPAAAAPGPGSGGAAAPGARSGSENLSAVIGAAPAGSANAPQPDAAGTSAAAAAGDAAGGAPCWPALGPAAAAALTGALPTGAFGAPGTLLGSCEQQAVAGAALPGSEPGTELVVRVVTAEPGACARSVGEAGSRCVASGNGRYTATDPSGGFTVLVYADGKEVAVGSRPAADGVPSVPTGLTADQLDAAARAVLASLR